MFGFAFTMWRSAVNVIVGGGGSPPAYSPSLDFSDYRNSMYL